MLIYYLFIFNVSVFSSDQLLINKSFLEEKIQINRNEVALSILDYFSYKDEEFKSIIRNNIVLKFHKESLIVLFEILKILDMNDFFLTKDFTKYIFDKLICNNLIYLEDLLHIINFLKNENLLMINKNTNILKVIFYNAFKKESISNLIEIKKILFSLKLNVGYKELFFEKNIKILEKLFYVNKFIDSLKIRGCILNIINSLNKSLLNKLDNLHISMNIFYFISKIINNMFTKEYLSSLYFLEHLGLFLENLYKSPLNNERYEKEYMVLIYIFIKGSKNEYDSKYKNNIISEIFLRLNEGDLLIPGYKYNILSEILLSLNSSLLEKEEEKYVHVINSILDNKFFYKENTYVLIKLLNVSCVDKVEIFYNMLIKIFKILEDYENSQSKKNFSFFYKSVGEILIIIKYIITNLNKSIINDYKDNSNYVKILNYILHEDVENIETYCKLDFNNRDLLHKILKNKPEIAADKNNEIELKTYSL